MKLKAHKIILGLLFLFFSEGMIAQIGNISRDQVIGGELFGDNFHMSYGFNIGIGTLPSSRNNFTFIDIGVLLNGRYNFYKINEDNALGIDIAPEVGSYSNGSLANYLGFSIPVLASYNFGLGSTYESNRRIGLALKAGLELDIGPLVGERIPNYTPLTVLYVVQLDARFWKRGRNNIRNLYFKYGYISNENDGLNFVVSGGGLYMID